MSNNRPKNKRPTIKDIATIAKVDPSTVARALQGSARVKSSTRKRIEQIAQELGYVPSAMARSLVTQRSHLIGVVIPEMTNPFFAALVHGIEHEAAQNNLSVLIRSTQGKQRSEREAVNLFDELHVDGIIVPMARCAQDFYNELNSNTPTVHVNREEAPLNVSCNSISGTEALVNHLLELGHQNIAFVNGPSGPAREPKYIGYCRALERAGLSPDESLLFDYDGTFSSVESLAKSLIDVMPRCTAVFAWNDVCAMGLVHEMQKQGVEVPGQLAIGGHDNIEFSGLTQPTLTSVQWPMYELGVASVRRIVNLHSDENIEPTLIPEPKLIVRASTGAHILKS